MAGFEPGGIYDKNVMYEGVTTSAGNAGGTTLIDTGLTQGTDYWKNMVVLMLSGSSNKQSRRISGFTTATGTITVDTAFASQIASGTRFAILSQHTGNGVGDATAANQVLILVDTNAILIDTAEIGAAGAGLTAVAQASVCTNTRLTELDAANIPTDIANVKTDTAAVLIDTAEIGAAGAGLTAVAQASVCLDARLAELDAANLPTDIDLIKTYTDNAYSTTASLDFTTEKTVFEIAVDTRYQIMSPWIDLTPFTSTATITFQFYRSVAAAGATYRKAGDAITKVVGTDNPIVEFADWTHYGYTKVTAVSNNAGDTAVTVPFGYLKKPLE